MYSILNMSVEHRKRVHH